MDCAEGALIEFLEERIGVKPIEADTELQGESYDSLLMVEIVFFIEDLKGSTLDLENVEIAELNTVRKICAALM
ncbi:hypothetical protein GCM10007385_31720 [Tateyamaria omphalii]|uniref:hypothetical protein n=1 Tax=Tateyamaria omphalii TaxID=299262 RepID=UPI00167750FF|nr:hypothetical protein [Tateyamaria omphalii]GGX60119.1 hypothetical protein GCM10007385_31720 [Tateyamaria omphalii]